MDRYRLLPSYYYQNSTDGVFTKSVGKDLRDYKIYGNSRQDGIPTPDAPIKVQSVGENTMVLPGENLFPFTEGTYTDGGVTFTASNGVVTITGRTTDTTQSDVISAITFERYTNYPQYATISQRRSILLESGTYKFSSTGATSTHTGVGLMIGDVGKSQMSSENPAIFVMNYGTFTITESKYCTPFYAKYISNTDYTITDIELRKIVLEPQPPEKYTNLVDIDYILEQNPKSTTTLERTIFQGRDVLRYVAGSKGSSVNLTPKGGFKENTPYTIRAMVATSIAMSGCITVYYTDGTYSQLRLATLAPNIEANVFREIVFFTGTYKTISKITGNYDSAQYIYIDIDSFSIIEGVSHTPYIPENTSKHRISLKMSSKNIADICQLYRYSGEIESLSTTSDIRTFIKTDEQGRYILSNYSAAGYGKDGYADARRMLQGIFKPSTQYTISFDCTSTTVATNISIRYTDGSSGSIPAISGWTDSSTVYHVSFTTAAGKTIDAIQLNYNSGFCYIYLDTLQIEEGTQETEHEPFGEYGIYLDEPLRKIGDSADYIDFKNQKVVRNVEVVDNTGTLSLDESLRGLTEPIEQSVELPKIPTKKGNCELSVNTQIQPSKTEYQYYRGGK